MLRVVSLLLLALIVAGVAFGFTVDPAGTARHAESVRATYPRPEASPSEARLIEYIVAVAQGNGLEATTTDFADSAAGHSFSSVVEIVVPGTGSATAVIVAPLNHPENASADEDRSASVAAALAVLDAIADAAPLPTTFRFLFPGAEYGEQPDYPLGTRRYLETYFAEGPHALLYLDASRLPLVVDTGGGGKVTPPWLLQRTLNAAGTHADRVGVTLGLNQLHRVDLTDAPAPLIAFLRADIPSVHLSSGESGLAPPSVAAVARELTQVTGDWARSFATDIPDTWDRHYLSFRVGSRFVLVAEQDFLLILLGVLLATLFYALVFRHKLKRYLRTTVRNGWNLPMLFLLIFGFLTAATQSLELLLSAHRFPTIWTWYPGAYFALKIALAFLLFTIAAQLLRYLPLSKRGSFYSASALFVLFIDIVIFSVIDVSLSYYFIWAYVWAFLFSVVRARSLKALTLLIAPFFLIAVTLNVFRVPELDLAERLLLSPRGDLLISFMILPFLLMLIRLDFLVRHPVRGRRSFALRIASIVSGVFVLGVLAFVLISSPFSPTNPQPVSAVETVDYPELERRLDLTSPAPLGEIRVIFAGADEEVTAAGREYSRSSTLLPDVLSVRLSYEVFLERDRGRLEIDAPLPLYNVSVSFTSPDPMVIYDVGYPVDVSPDRRSARISIGRRPPLPLVVNFTLARGVNPTIEIEAESLAHPDPLRVIGDNLAVESRLVVRTRLDP